MSARRATLVLNPAARRDVRSILLFTRKQWGQNARDAYEEALNQAMLTLSENPRIGRLRSTVPGDLRTFRVRQHVIYYRLSADTLTVIRVLHGKMDPSQHLIEN
jgi:toxin ParE1/3/4